MNNPNAEKDEHGEDPRATKEQQHQQKLTILNLYRLLETAVQNSQFKIADQIVVRTQDIVGPIKSARTSFEERNVKAVIELNQAAESFRNKVVRWEAEARAAQAGQRQLAASQKRKLPAEIATVRSAARKTNIFFDRLAAALAEWARTIQPEQELPEESDDTLEGTTKQESIYERDRRAYAPEPEIKRKMSVSAEGLTMMVMMVRQQFEELGKLFGGARDRDVGDPFRSAFDAFNKGNYQTARLRLKSAHEVFIHAVMTRRIAQAEVAEERFETLLQSTNKLAEAANQKSDMTSLGPATPAPATPKAASDPVRDLRKLQQIMQNELEKVFPPGSSYEQRKTAMNCMAAIASGPLAELPENLRALLRATRYGADNNAPETKKAKEIIKRLATHTPEQIRPPRGTKAKTRDRVPAAGPETDGGEITLDFMLTATKCFTVEPVNVREVRQLQLEFRNASTEPARLEVQIYNAADKPILSRPEPLLLPATKDTNKHAADIAEKIDPGCEDTLAVNVEFVDVPEHVQISSASFV